jgi:hypothetical protein
MGSSSSKQSDHVKYQRPNILENPWIAFSYDEKSYADLANATTTYEGIINAFEFISKLYYNRQCMHKENRPYYCGICRKDSFYEEDDSKVYPNTKWIAKMPVNTLVYIPMIPTNNVYYRFVDEGQSIEICSPYVFVNIKDQNDKNVLHIIKLNDALSKLMLFYDSYTKKGLKNDTIDKYKPTIVSYKKYINDNMSIIINTCKEIKKIIDTLNDTDVDANIHANENCKDDIKNDVDNNVDNNVDDVEGDEERDAEGFNLGEGKSNVKPSAPNI